MKGDIIKDRGAGEYEISHEQVSLVRLDPPAFVRCSKICIEVSLVCTQQSSAKSERTSQSDVIVGLGQLRFRSEVIEQSGHIFPP